MQQKLKMQINYIYNIKYNLEKLITKSCANIRNKNRNFFWLNADFYGKYNLLRDEISLNEDNSWRNVICAQ